jgi:hypothetical protein
MERHYPPLAIMALMACLMAILVVVPVAEWLSVYLYLVVVTLLALALYRKGILPADTHFPAALFLLAVAAKLLFSLGRYWTIVDLYEGAGDALGYHEQGLFLAPYFRAFDLTVLDWYQYMAGGTRNLAVLTGLVYAFMPASLPGIFLLFAGLALAGAVFFYRTARLAAPDRDIGIYRLLIFFMPSVLFWPASLGKDAWVFCCSGIAVWGWALFVRRNQLGGLLVAGAAVVAVSFVRAHVATLLILAMAVSYFLYSSRSLNQLPKLIAGGVVMAGVAVVVFNAGVDLLQLDELSLEAFEERYILQQELTSIGGSEIQATSAFSLTGFGRGIVTVLLRPFPWEARNAQNLLAAVETILWLGIFWHRRRSFLANVRAVRRDPLMGLCLFYSLGIIFALTAISNLGIVARQRVMMLPFLWMLFL